MIAFCMGRWLVRVTCKYCKVAMKQEDPRHLFHGNRKWRCPQCGRVRMQKPRVMKKGAA